MSLRNLDISRVRSTPVQCSQAFVRRNADAYRFAQRRRNVPRVTGNAVVREIDNEAETLMTSDQSLQRPNNEAHFGMILDKDVPVPMRGGAILRANVFRPDDSAQFPVLMTFGPYGKDIHLSQFMPEAWEHLNRRHPEILQASSCQHLVFETPDPEMWVPYGYIIVK